MELFDGVRTPIDMIVMDGENTEPHELLRRGERYKPTRLNCGD